MPLSIFISTNMSEITLYILKSKTVKKRYIGITNNLNRRLKQHSQQGTTVNKLLGDFELVHTETFSNYKEARIREKFFKSGKGREWMNNNLNDEEPAKGG